jgi:transcriptional regulator with XRE-family HTH domain
MPRAKIKRPGGKRGAVALDAQIGGRLRAVRLDRGWSQTKLGDVLGVSFQQVQKYERGANRVSVSRAHQIADALKVSLEQLVGNGEPTVDGFAFDTESYKLAREFSRLPDRLKAKFRSLIAAVVKEDE